MEYDVVILGGGFAGVECAKILGKYKKGKDFLRVAIISNENYMVFQPMLPEVAGASISPEHIINTIRHICPGVDVFKGEINSVSYAEKIIKVNAGSFSPNHQIKFKKLVFTLGAHIDLSRVPGMPEHALLMQNIGDAMRLRATVIQRFEEANICTDPKIRKRLLSFVIVGGGYSGVETAAQILDLMKEMNKHYHGVSGTDFRVFLIHSRGQLLPTLSSKLGEYCYNKLIENGMEVILNKRVRSVTSNTCVLNDDRIIETSTIVSTIGNSPHPRVIDFCNDNSIEMHEGRIKTNEFLQVLDNDEIWAAGDCAAVPLINEDEYCPGNAQFAMRQGKLIGQNIVSSLEGRKLKKFKFTGLGELATIGHHSAVASIMGLQFSGFLAWWMWRTIYLMKLPGLKRKIEICIDWTLDVFFARDINLLNPRYSRMLKTVNLEAGDLLFNPGEPAFSIYFVKKGVVEILDGEEIVKTVREGEYCGERAVLGDGIWKYTAKAAESCSLVSLAAGEFKEIIAGSTELQKLFTRSLQMYQGYENMDSIKENLKPGILSKKIEALMTKNPVSISSDTSIKDALLIFKKNRHGSYPVVDSLKKYIGTISRDTVYDDLKVHEDHMATKIRDLKLNQLPTISITAIGNDALELLIKSNKNKLIVLNDKEEVVGILTTYDLLIL